MGYVPKFNKDAVDAHRRSVHCAVDESECPLYDEVMKKGHDRYRDFLGQLGPNSDTPPAIVASHFSVSAMMTCPLYDESRNLIEDDKILDCPMGSAAVSACFSEDK